jgi:hypothetical protein
MSLSVLAALLLGLASTLHCWGMCGGIVAAFTLGVPGHAGPMLRGTLVFAFNAGRVLSYTVAGAAAGAAGGALLTLPWRGPIHLGLQLAAGFIVVLAGLRLGGWWRRDGWLERGGARVWAALQPACRRLLPVERLTRALALGALWGAIPCGLVYSALAVAAARGDATGGAALMLAFGAGTLPGMIAAGLAGAELRARFGHPSWRRGLALALIAAGLSGPLVSWHIAGDGDHTGHAGHHGSVRS